MNIFDTHCHLNLDPLYSNWQEHWEKAQENGVTKMFIPGTTLESSQNAINIAKQDKNILAGVAVHPSEITKDTDIANILSSLDNLIANNRKYVSGIGETGLDYYWLENNQEKQNLINQQKDLFSGHIKLANKYKLPLSIHVRDKKEPERKTSNNAYWDTLSLVQQLHAGSAAWILHCVSGPIAYLQAAMESGAFVSFAGNVTYSNASQLRSLLSITKNTHLLIETDAPYLPPQAFRGKICEPWMITHTAQFIKKEKNIRLESLRDNADKVFAQVH